MHCVDWDRGSERNDKAALAEIERMPPVEWNGPQQQGLQNLLLESVGRRNAMKPMHLGDPFAEGNAVGRIAERPKLRFNRASPINDGLQQ